MFPIKKKPKEMKNFQERSSAKPPDLTSLYLLCWFPGNIPAFVYCSEQKLARSFFPSTRRDRVTKRGEVSSHHTIPQEQL